MRLPFLVAFALAAIVAPPLPAQSPAESAKMGAVTAAVQKFVDDGDLSGAVFAYGNKAGVVQLQAVGFRDLATKDAMRADSLFRIASMTKPVTALAVMILADEGKLKVTDPVEKYLPEFKGQKLAVKGADGKTTLTDPARPVTLEDLLTHTSGLPGGYPAPMGEVYLKRDYTLAETVAAVAKRPLQSPPGEKWAYCNPGIDTLGRVVEVVSGKPYEVVLKERIFTPLGMTDTTPYPTPDQLKRLAVTYNKDKGGKLVKSGPAVLDFSQGAKHPVPAGGLFSTAADLTRLYRMLLNKGELDGKRIVSEAALAEMTRDHLGEKKAGFVPESGMGLGFLLVRKPTGVTEALAPGTFGHGGAFGTQSWADPTNDRFFILLIQRTGLQNGDASPMRKAFQDAAVAAVKK